MNGTGVIRSQFEVVHSIFQSQMRSLEPHEWTARTRADGNLIGFEFWHMAATQDWVVQVVLRGLPEVRQSVRWRDHSGVNPPVPPFGMSLEQADQIAHAASAQDIAAYEQDVYSVNLAWLTSIDDPELDRVPDLRANALERYLQERVTEHYVTELADQMSWSVCRFLTSPAIGHLRGHFGEIDAELEHLRRR
jgi:hypothetical protein